MLLLSLLLCLSHGLLRTIVNEEDEMYCLELKRWAITALKNDRCGMPQVTKRMEVCRSAHVAASAGQEACTHLLSLCDDRGVLLGDEVHLPSLLLLELFKPWDQLHCRALEPVTAAVEEALLGQAARALQQEVVHDDVLWSRRGRVSVVVLQSEGRQRQGCSQT